MRRKLLLAALAALLLAGAWVAAWRPLPLVGEPPADGYVRVRGVSHVHTVLSDGSGTVADVLAAARARELDFVLLTDHNTLAAKPEEGWHDRTLLLVGEEASTQQGHVIVAGMPPPAFRFSGDAADVLDDVRALGGAAIVTHPTSPRADLRFTGWDLPGPWGLEVANADTQWRAAGRARWIAAALQYPLNRSRALLTLMPPVDDALARWDQLLARRPAPGWAGADAHQRIPLTRRRALDLPSYAAVFGLFQDHLVLDRPLTHTPADSAAIVEALQRGRGYVGLDALADAGGFTFTAEAGGRRWTMGDNVPVTPAPVLRAGGRLPRGARVRLLRDGVLLREDAGPLELTAPGPGVYRVEVRVPGWSVPWVISNPIAVHDDAAAAAWAAGAAWPGEPPVPPERAVLDRFEAGGSFAAEFDPRSQIAPAFRDPRGGPEGGPAAHLAFRLGETDPAHPYVSCALVSRKARDLTGAQGLVFSLRSDRPYRLWVQVRDDNPASADEGTEWWFASVRSSTEWRRVAVPFSRLRSINPRTDGRLDLDKVRGLVFLIDAGAELPGTRGDLWLADLGTY